MKAALVALFAGSALALNARHEALHHRRGLSPLYQPQQDSCCKTVVTVTVWDDCQSSPVPSLDDR